WTSTTGSSLPGFRITFLMSTTPAKNSTSVNLQIFNASHYNAGAVVRSPEFCALIRACAEIDSWEPVVAWLVEHSDVGNDRFRVAIGFVASGDPEGWRAWCVAQPERHDEAERRMRKECRIRERQLDAYEHLCSLREASDSYWIVVLARG